MRNQRSPLYDRAQAGYEFDALQRQAKLGKFGHAFGTTAKRCYV